MSNQVDSLSFLFPYISFNDCRNNYKAAIANLKPVVDQLVANGAQNKNELLSLAALYAIDPASVSNELDQLNNDENNLLSALNNFLNPSQ